MSEPLDEEDFFSTKTCTSKKKKIKMTQKPFSTVVQKTFGVGNKKTQQLFKWNGLNMRANPKHLKTKQSHSVNKTIKTYNTGKNLKGKTYEFIEFLIKTRTYKGVRHKLKYPARGQRTHTNAKTSKKKQESNLN
jgi:small subunit ribosomal protein S13